MRTICRTSTLIAIAVTVLSIGACNDTPSLALKGQINTTIQFYGLVVDQDGNPRSRTLLQCGTAVAPPAREEAAV